MTYNELSPKDKRYYAKFRRIVELHNVRDESGVQDVVSMLSSPQMKSIPLVLSVLAIACGFFAGKDMVAGNIPILLPLLSAVFLWFAIQNIRTITTTIPMIAKIYTEEDLPKRQKTSKKKRKRMENQSA